MVWTEDVIDNDNEYVVTIAFIILDHKDISLPLSFIELKLKVIENIYSCEQLIFIETIKLKVGLTRQRVSVKLHFKS